MPEAPHQTAPVELDAHAASLDDTEIVACVVAGDENALIGNDLLIVIQTAIDRLPEEFRSVFMLRGVEQLSIAETACLLELKPATVKTRFHRARRLLQDTLNRKLDHAARHAFGFDGARCDAVVTDVLQRIKARGERTAGGSGAIAGCDLRLPPIKEDSLSAHANHLARPRPQRSPSPARTPTIGPASITWPAPGRTRPR
jgi:hypothetical protein